MRAGVVILPDARWPAAGRSGSEPRSTGSITSGPTTTSAGSTTWTGPGSARPDPDRRRAEHDAHHARPARRHAELPASRAVHARADRPRRHRRRPLPARPRRGRRRLRRPGARRTAARSRRTRRTASPSSSTTLDGLLTTDDFTRSRGRVLHRRAVPATCPARSSEPRPDFVIAANGPRAMRVAVRHGSGRATTGRPATAQAAWWKGVAELAARFDEALDRAGHDRQQFARFLNLDAAPISPFRALSLHGVGRAGRRTRVHGHDRALAARDGLRAWTRISARAGGRRCPALTHHAPPRKRRGVPLADADGHSNWPRRQPRRRPARSCGSSARALRARDDDVPDAARPFAGHMRQLLAAARRSRPATLAACCSPPRGLCSAPVTLRRHGRRRPARDARAARALHGADDGAAVDAAARLARVHGLATAAGCQLVATRTSPSPPRRRRSRSRRQGGWFCHTRSSRSLAPCRASARSRWPSPGM